jgi:hypothetical protein
MHELTVIPPGELVRQSTDIAGLCRDIVLKCSMEIQKRKYVKVEGWQSIATAHGCVASSKDVERIDGGYRAIGEVRRMNDGFVIASAEGFVGEDEVTWFGGEHEVWNRESRKREKKALPKRPDYAIRAMAQTRAISRACRSAFAHVVVLMDAGLQTTPAEEVPFGGFNDGVSEDNAIEERQEQREQNEINREVQIKGWRDVVCTFGKKNGPLRGKKLGDLNPESLLYLCEMFLVDGKEIKPNDKKMVAGLAIWKAEQSTPAPKEEKWNGPNHEKLTECLAWENPEIKREDFMAALKDAKLIPVEAKSFSSMSDETAKSFLDDYEVVKQHVRNWQAKQNPA